MSVLKLYNDSYEASTLKVHKSKSGCCGSELPFCRYVIEATITAVTSITLTIDGSPQVISFDSVSTPKDVRKAIATALKSKGYDPYFEDHFKGIYVDADKIVLVGEAVLASAMINGSPEAATAQCVEAGVSRLLGSLDFSTDPGLLSLDGAAGTQIGTVGGFAAGNKAAVKAAIEAALTTQGAAFERVEVSESATYGNYTYVISTTETAPITVAAVALTLVGGYPSFVA